MKAKKGQSPEVKKLVNVIKKRIGQAKEVQPDDKSQNIYFDAMEKMNNARSKLVFLSDVLSGGQLAGYDFTFGPMNNISQYGLDLILDGLAKEFKAAEDGITKAWKLKKAAA